MRVESGFAENMFVNLLKYIIAHFICSEISHFAAAFHGKKIPVFLLGQCW